MKIFTIGYEGLSLDAFLSLLAANGIDTVVDVRELPLSRKPGFSKKALANHLELAGLEYVHLVALGCPKPVRDGYRKDGDWQRYTKGFMRHLATQGNAIAGLSTLAAQSNCALLCYETDAKFCHRSMVADALKNQHAAQVTHIKAAARTRAAEAELLPAFA